MILKSEVTGKEYEVKLYQIANDQTKYGFIHDSLQDILENKLVEDDVSYEIEIIVASEKYCAVKCTIKDTKGRVIVRYNDISTEHVSTREAQQQIFAKEHPLMAAINSAIDNAVKAYLKFPKVIISEENIEKSENEQKELSEPSPDLKELLEANKPEDNTFTGMNPPVESEEEELERLGKLKAPENSKYKDMTLDEIWEKYPNWFNYIKKSNRSVTYVDARRFAELKEKQKEQQ